MIIFFSTDFLVMDIPNSCNTHWVRWFTCGVIMVIYYILLRKHVYSRLAKIEYLTAMNVMYSEICAFHFPWSLNQPRKIHIIQYEECTTFPMTDVSCHTSYEVLSFGPYSKMWIRLCLPAFVLTRQHWAYVLNGSFSMGKNVLKC